MTPETVIDWLLEGDVAIQYQTSRDLLDSERPDLRARIATEGWGARYLAARNPDTSWGRGYYQPKWTSTHYTLLDLKNLGIAPDRAEIRESVRHLLYTEKRPDGGMGPGESIKNSDVCVSGMFLNYASYFNMPEEDLHSIVDFLLHEHMADGGFNCQSNRARPHHSSLHTTLSVLEGFAQFSKAGYTYRQGDIQAAIATAREFILIHRLFRSDHSGEVIKAEFLKWPYPFRWKYNIVRALDHFALTGWSYDPRMKDALEHRMSKQTPDGRWKVNSAHAGEQHFVMEPAGKPSLWITLIACRILRAYAGPAGLED